MKPAKIYPKKLLVITHVRHALENGRLIAFGPFVREIDIWADLFDRVEIAAPQTQSNLLKGDCIPYSRKNIVFTSIPMNREANRGLDLIKLPLIIPTVVLKLRSSMLAADCVHMRGPGDLGFIGSLMARLYCDKYIAKYAGTWPDYSGEPWSYRLQKFVLKSRWFGAPVTVYGRWPGQPANIKPFFTSIMTQDQIARAQASSTQKQLHSPVRILFVGRMDRGKNAHILLNAIAILISKGIDIQARIIGDGEEMNALQNQTRELELTSHVKFIGAIPFNQVLDEYAWGDILVLASENSEGWPKAIAEGMAFGLVCVGSERGLIPQMLSDQRGLVVWPVTYDNLAIKLEEIVINPILYKEISQNAAAWAQNYSLEGLREALRELLIREWRLPPDALCPEKRDECPAG